MIVLDWHARSSSELKLCLNSLIFLLWNGQAAGKDQIITWNVAWICLHIFLTKSSSLVCYFLFSFTPDADDTMIRENLVQHVMKVFTVKDLYQNIEHGICTRIQSMGSASKEQRRGGPGWPHLWLKSKVPQRTEVYLWGVPKTILGTWWSQDLPTRPSSKDEVTCFQRYLKIPMRTLKGPLKLWSKPYSVSWKASC